MPEPTQKIPPRAGSAAGQPREQVLVCGLGLRLANITLETLQALRQCRAVFHASLDKKTEQYVRGLCPDVRDLRKIPGAGDSSGMDAVLAEAAPGGTVAFLHYGHPMLFQEDTLIARCKAAKIPYRVLAALSSLDAVLAAVGTPLLQNGLQIRHADGLGRKDPLLPASPAIILSLDRLWPPRNAGAAAFVKYLEEVYSPGHLVTLIRCPHLADASVLRQGTELRALAGRLEKIPKTARGSTSLFIPSPNPSM